MSYNFDIELEIRDLRNGDWFWVNQVVLEDKNLTPADNKVYSGLACFVGQGKKGQMVFPSINTIASKIQLSPRQIKLSTKNLENHGYIKRVPRQIGNRTAYVLLKVSSAKSALAERVGQITTESSADFSKSGANATHELGSNNLINNIKNNNSELPKGTRINTCSNKEEGHKGCIEFIDSLQKERNTKFPTYAKQINALHKLLASGYNFESINTQIDRMEKDRFWKSRGFDLMNVVNEIAKGGEYGNSY